MKIRYYLRGLGLGILVTAVFFLLGNNSNKIMSDEMIKERAKELGMVESTVLAQMNTSAEETAASDESEAVETEIMQSVETTEESSEEAAETESASEEVTGEDENVTEETLIGETVEDEPETQQEAEGDSGEDGIENAQDGETISIVVNKGEGSDVVSQRLRDAGLIDDAYSYDRYLMQNGYDKRISAGEHMIPQGATWQEIAQILCR